MSESTNIEIENIDHLGIIAGIVDEVGIVEIVNKKLPSYPTEKISKGLVVKAMILNALGFVSGPLYLFSEFFNNKAIEKLLGKEVEKQKKRVSKKLWCDKKECEREIKKKNKRFKYYELEIEEIRKQEKGKYEVSIVVKEKEEEIEKKKNQGAKKRKSLKISKIG